MDTVDTVDELEELIGLPLDRGIAVLSKTYTQPETPLEDLESYYGPSYAERMYRD